MSVSAAPRAHGREGGVAGRVQKRDRTAWRGHVIGTDMLGNGAGLASRHLRLADVVQQRGLAVIDMAHDRDDRGAGHALAGRRQLGEQGLRALWRRHCGGMPHLLDHQHRGVLIQCLIDGGHLPHAHQALDHLGRLDRHAACELRHGDADRHLNLAGNGTLRAFELMPSGASAGPAMGARPGAAAQPPLGVITKAAALVTPTFLRCLPAPRPGSSRRGAGCAPRAGGLPGTWRGACGCGRAACCGSAGRRGGASAADVACATAGCSGSATGAGSTAGSGACTISSDSGAGCSTKVAASLSAAVSSPTLSWSSRLT